MESRKILVIEDEKEIREMIEILLKRQSYQVTSFSNCEDILNESKKHAGAYDLIVLDWMLPEQSGIEFLKQIRQDLNWKFIPVLMVTAKTEPDEIILGLETGADDYLIKPFDTSIFLARIKTLLRRANTSSETILNPNGILHRGGLMVNPENYEAYSNGQKIPLTLSEFKILIIMLQHPGKFFTRDQLVHIMHGENISVIGRTIDTHVFALRKKLGALGHQIETARGIGYCFRESKETS